MINKSLFFGVLLLTVSGCSNKDLYSSFQPDKADCRQQPQQQRDACNKSVDEQMNYNEYKKERNKL